MVIYADNAATTKLDIDAFEAMKPFLLDNYANPSGAYSFSKGAKQAIKSARSTIAECINAEPEQIYFTSGGTESDNWAIKGFALADHDYRVVITSQIEHHAILNSCYAIERLKHPVAYLPVDNKGVVTVDSLLRYITNQTGLVSIMTANNEIGTIEPIKELAKIAHSHGALFHTDAVQAIGHIPIDVNELGVDMLSASAHKFNGPKGIGFLYCKEGILQPFHSGGSQEFGMRAGTENVPAIVGMAVALKKNIQEIEQNIKYLKHLTEVFFSIFGASSIPYILNGHETNRLPGNINLSNEPIGVARLLWDRGYVAYLSDVIVESNYRNNGIGTTMVSILLEKLKNEIEPGWKVLVFLMAAKGVEEYYERFGFIKRPNEKKGAGMSLTIKK